MSHKKTIHILVIRLSAMGDVAMTVPVLRALLQQNANLKITVVTRAFFSPFFDEFENITLITPDLKGEHKGFFGILRLFKSLKSLKFDAVADLHNVLRSKILVTLFRINGTPCAQLNKGRKEKKLLTKNDVTKKLHPLKTMHQRYALVFHKLGLSLDLSTIKTIQKRKVSTPFFNKYKGKPVIGIAPFTAFKSKSLPINILEQILQKLNFTEVILFGGGEKEKEILENVAKKYNNVTSIIQKVTFKEELDIIANLDVMIGMDSGNGHIAAMLQTPVITIWGLTHPYLGFTAFNQPKTHQVTPDLTKYPLIPTSVYGNKFPEEYLTCFNTINIDKIIDLVKKHTRTKKE